MTLVEGGTITNLGLGKGHDLLSAAALTLGTAATLNLGEGRDTIVIDAMATTLSAATIVGDAAGGTNYGADSIFIDVLQSGSTVKGQGGDDTITISADSYNNLFINGGGQNDVITISGYDVASTIGGGSGNDTITVLEGLADSAYFNGGKGADSIHIENSSQLAMGENYIMGGAGADSITVSAGGTISGAVLPTLKYSAFSESNLDNLDVMTFTLANASGGAVPTLALDYGIDLSAATVSERSALNINGIASTFSGNITNGIVTLSGASIVSSVTAVAATVDTLTLGEGANTVAAFTTTGGEETYFFVQGGAAGTADDSIVHLGTLSGVASVTTTNNTAVITFNVNG